MSFHLHFPSYRRIWRHANTSLLLILTVVGGYRVYGLLAELFRNDASQGNVSLFWRGAAVLYLFLVLMSFGSFKLFSTFSGVGKNTQFVYLFLYSFLAPLFLLALLGLSDMPLGIAAFWLLSGSVLVFTLERPLRSHIIPNWPMIRATLIDHIMKKKNR